MNIKYHAQYPPPGLPELFFCLYNILVNICGVRIGVLKRIMAKSPVVDSTARICAALCLFVNHKTDRWVPGKE